MNNFNYALFEILKYKVDVCELLEYGLPIYNIDTTDINSKYNSIKSTYEDGTYKDIVQSLFTDYENINKAIKDFIQYYNPNKITKLSKDKKLKNIITYHKAIVDCYETISSVYTNILNEKDIYSITNKKIINLEKIITKHYINFLFFNLYHLYIEVTANSKTKIKFKENDIKELVSLIKYCNKNNDFGVQINALLTNDREKINSNTQKLTTKCMNLERKLKQELNELIVILNNELESK